MKSTDKRARDSRPPRVNAVLFDYDGVVVDSEPVHAYAWNQLIEEVGTHLVTHFGARTFDGGPALVKASIGRTSPEILEILVTDGFKVPQGRVPAEKLREWVDRKNELYIARCPGHLEAFAGVPHRISELRALGIKTAIVSNARRKELLVTLEQLGMSSHFDLVLARDDVPRHKPDPAPYRIAAETLGFAAASCAAIEDSPSGLKSAVAAGVYTIAVKTTHGEPPLLEVNPDAIFESPNQALDEILSSAR